MRSYSSRGSSYRIADPRRDPGSPLLTPQEFLAVYQVLPSHADLASPPAVTRALLALRERYPALVAREPAATMLGNLERFVQQAKSAPR